MIINESNLQSLKTTFIFNQSKKAYTSSFVIPRHVYKRSLRRTKNVIPLITEQFKIDTFNQNYIVTFTSNLFFPKTIFYENNDLMETFFQDKQIITDLKELEKTIRKFQNKSHSFFISQINQQKLLTNENTKNSIKRNL